MSRLSKTERIELWLDRLNRQASSLESVAAFCEREQISCQSFYSWKRRLSPRVEVPRKNRTAASGQRQPSGPANSLGGQSGFAELVVASSAEAAQVQLPGGIRISLGTRHDVVAVVVDRLVQSCLTSHSDETTKPC